MIFRTARMARAYHSQKRRIGAAEAERLFSILRRKSTRAREPEAWLTWALEQDAHRVLSDSEIAAMHGKIVERRTSGAMENVSDIIGRILSSGSA